MPLSRSSKMRIAAKFERPAYIGCWACIQSAISCALLAAMKIADRRVRAGQHQAKRWGSARLASTLDERAFDHARPTALRAITHRAGQFVERQITLIRRTGKPIRGHPTDALAATHVHSATAAGVAAGIENLQIHGSNLHDGRRKTLLRPSTRHGERRPALPLLHCLSPASTIFRSRCSSVRWGNPTRSPCYPESGLIRTREGDARWLYSLDWMYP
jgi:hypothetical protein